MRPSIESSEPSVDLAQMLSLFFLPGEEGNLGSFRCVEGNEVKQPHRKLLDHHSHMTVAVESHFHSPVDVHVIRTSKDDTWYAREILLATQTTGQIVQYGIVRLRYGFLAPAVWQEIESGLKPLGRVLIEHDVLRQVELVGLWEVSCGPTLATHFVIRQGEVTFGRTARIFCDSEPAIELLEIIRPV